jgi:phenylpyruvate tautomerase PptA (4-oxalocrotonate tautomerase family)
MPIYTCTTTESTLTADGKTTLAGEIADIHSAINQVPSTYVNVVFHELSPAAIYTDGRPALPPRSPRP